MARGHPATPPCVSVNISGRAAPEPGPHRRAARRRSTRRVQPDGVVLEITESVLMQQTETVRSAAAAQGRSACGSPSTTSAPGTPRSATCSASRSTSSRSPSRSWTKWAGHREVGPGPGDRRAGRDAQARDHRRGDRAGRPARRAARARLRPGPGALLLPGASTRRDRPAAHGPARRGRTADERGVPPSRPELTGDP